MTQASAAEAAWPVLGHSATVEYLRRSIAAGRTSHAYLFTGPAGIGRRTLATALFQALNCPADPAPCGECRTCRLIAEGSHPDVRTIQMPADKREIGIDQIRALQHEATLKPYEAARKCYLVRDAEHLSEEAANCLLKTLEEPPPHVTVVLTAPTAEAMLPTIVSRCQVFNLHPVPAPLIEDVLHTRHGCEPDRARVLARISAGRVGWAIRAAADPEIADSRQRLLDRLAALSRATRVDRLAFAAEHGQRYGKDMAEREAVHAMLDLWALWWRDLLLTSSGRADLVINLDREEALRAEAQRFPFQQAHAFLDALSLAGQRLRQNVNPRLALEVLVLAMPRAVS